VYRRFSEFPSIVVGSSAPDSLHGSSEDVGGVKVKGIV